MSADALNAIAATGSAVASLAALAVAYLSYRVARAADDARRAETAHALDAALSARLDPLYPRLRALLGGVEDSLSDEVRSVMVPFFVLFSDAWSAHRDRLLSDHDWHGFGSELVYWAQKPVAKEAWGELRKQEWAEGFCAYVDAAVAGPSPYPGLVNAPPTGPVPPPGPPAPRAP